MPGVKTSTDGEHPRPMSTTRDGDPSSKADLHFAANLEAALFESIAPLARPVGGISTSWLVLILCESFHNDSIPF